MLSRLIGRLCRISRNVEAKVSEECLLPDRVVLPKARLETLLSLNVLRG
jgi:hypothetical protein